MWAEKEREAASMLRLFGWSLHQRTVDEGPRFGGFPDRWLVEPTWGCVKGHVSQTTQKTGNDEVCLECSDVVVPIPPDTQEPGPWLEPSLGDVFQCSDKTWRSFDGEQWRYIEPPEGGSR